MKLAGIGSVVEKAAPNTNHKSLCNLCIFGALHANAVPASTSPGLIEAARVKRLPSSCSNQMTYTGPCEASFPELDPVRTRGG